MSGKQKIGRGSKRRSARARKRAKRCRRFFLESAGGAGAGFTYGGGTGGAGDLAGEVSEHKFLLLRGATVRDAREERFRAVFLLSSFENGFLPRPLLEGAPY